jgi:hypothetical protein
MEGNVEPTVQGIALRAGLEDRGDAQLGEALI